MNSKHEPLFHCGNCLDTSWHAFRCDGGTGDTGDRDSHLKRYHCGRRNQHAFHTYVERCACYATNPKFKRPAQPEAA